MAVGYSKSATKFVKQGKNKEIILWTLLKVRVMKTSSVNEVARRNNIWELSETKARVKGTDLFGQTKSRRL